MERVVYLRLYENARRDLLPQIISQRLLAHGCEMTIIRIRILRSAENIREIKEIGTRLSRGFLNLVNDDGTGSILKMNVVLRLLSSVATSTPRTESR